MKLRPVAIYFLTAIVCGNPRHSSALPWLQIIDRNKQNRSERAGLGSGPSCSPHDALWWWVRGRGVNG